MARLGENAQKLIMRGHTELGIVCISIARVSIWQNQYTIVKLNKIKFKKKRKSFRLIFSHYGAEYTFDTLLTAEYSNSQVSPQGLLTLAIIHISNGSQAFLLKSFSFFLKHIVDDFLHCASFRANL